MRHITKEELDEVIEEHRKWINTESEGRIADLRFYDLRGLNLKGADLRCSDFEGSNLSHANLDFSDLSCSNLKNTDLSHTNLEGANMNYVNLYSANLYDSDLRGTDLYDANIKGAKNINTVITDEETKFLNNQCPKEGEFVGWKKCYNHIFKNNGRLLGCEECIVKLLIPSDAKRSSATTKKCRCSKAIVLAIYDMNGKEIKDKEFEAYSNYDGKFKYKVGQTVVPDKFDEDWCNECSSGIHFFMERESAEKY